MAHMLTGSHTNIPALMDLTSAFALFVKAVGSHELLSNAIGELENVCNFKMVCRFECVQFALTILQIEHVFV